MTKRLQHDILGITNKVGRRTPKQTMLNTWKGVLKDEHRWQEDWVEKNKRVLVSRGPLIWEPLGD